MLNIRDSSMHTRIFYRQIRSRYSRLKQCGSQSEPEINTVSPKRSMRTASNVTEKAQGKHIYPNLIQRNARKLLEYMKNHDVRSRLYVTESGSNRASSAVNPLLRSDSIMDIAE